MQEAPLRVPEQNALQENTGKENPPETVVGEGRRQSRCCKKEWGGGGVGGGGGAGNRRKFYFNNLAKKTAGTRSDTSLLLYPAPEG